MKLIKSVLETNQRVIDHMRKQSYGESDSSENDRFFNIALKTRTKFPVKKRNFVFTFDGSCSRSLNSVDNDHRDGNQLENEIVREFCFVLIKHTSVEIVERLLTEVLNLTSENRTKPKR